MKLTGGLPVGRHVLPAGQFAVGLSGSHRFGNMVPGPTEGHPDPITPAIARARHWWPPPERLQQSLLAPQSLGPSQVLEPVPPLPFPHWTCPTVGPLEQPSDVLQMTYAPLVLEQLTFPATLTDPRQ
jgi:hypothetical protein